MMLFCSFALQGKESSSQLQFWPRMLGSSWALSTSKGIFHTHPNMFSHVQLFIKSLCCSVKFIYCKLDLFDFLFLCDLFRLMKYANSILDSKLRGEFTFETYLSRPTRHRLWNQFQSRPSKKVQAHFIEALIISCINNILYFVCGLDLVMLGVGYHHAGVDLSDRKLIEKAFTLGDLPVLCETWSLMLSFILCCKQICHYISVQHDLCFYFLCNGAEKKQERRVSQVTTAESQYFTHIVSAAEAL